MKSGVFWVASSDKQIGQARNLLRSLTQPGVLDELGFLILLGALSDRLYPAINTIMTRARYLVFVPVLFRYIEERQLARHKSADSISRDFQFRLCSALRTGAPGESGIIGKDAGREVVRLPSNVYWNALADLGIASTRTSETSYLERLSRGPTSTGRLQDDDGAVHAISDDSFWDTRFNPTQILSSNGEFAQGTSFALTYYEAKQLQNRYSQLRPDDGTSLLSHLLDHGAKSRDAQVDFPAPWEVPGLPANLRHVIGHARLLSLFARGAWLQYHALLFDKRRTKDPGTQQAFEAWWVGARGDLLAWDLKDFSALPCVSRARRPGDVVFLDDWRNAICSQRTARLAYHDESARDCLRQRERAIRGHKARLKSPFHLRTWLAPEKYNPDDSYMLSFRHFVGTRFALDIVAGLRRGGR